MITLYAYPMSCSLAVHIALRATGTPFEIAWVSLPSAVLADGTAYETINPRRQVPAIASEGVVLTETPAILQYIADRVPEAAIAPPAGSLARAQLQEALNYFATEVHKQVLWQLSNIRKFPEPIEDHRAVLMEFLSARLDFMSAQLAGRSFYLGEAFTIADAYMAVILHWATRNGADLAAWPVLDAYRERLHAVPAVHDALSVDGAERARLIASGIPA